MIPLPDPKWIEAATAVVVLKPSMSVDAATLIAHAKARLSHFKVPKHVFFVDDLLRNASGRMLKRVLRDELVIPT